MSCYACFAGVCDFCLNMEGGDKVSKGTPRTKTTAINTAKGKQAVGSSREGYDALRFIGVHAENAYRKTWVQNGAVIEREIRLNAFGDFGWEREFANRGWLGLASFKGECIVTLCAEFMANISSPIAEKGNERIVSWVRGKEIILTPDTFAHYYGLGRVENPDFEYPDVGAPPLSIICNELLKRGETWDGEVQCSKQKLTARYLILFLFSCHSLMPLKRTVDMSLARAQLLWAIGTGKSIDLPRYMFMQLYHAYTHPNPKGSIPFTCLLTKLIKESKAKFPRDLITQDQDTPIDDATLSRSEGQKKRKKEVEELRRRASAEGGSGQMSGADIASLQVAVEQQGQKLDAFITSTDGRLKNIEDHVERNTAILQEMFAMMMRGQPPAGGDDDGDD